MARPSYRKLYDYYYEQQWVFRIGYAQFLKAHSPLPPHVHEDMTEFVYLERGCQKYQIADRSFLVNQGEFFFTRPNELHDTGSSPEERSSIYYLIVNLGMAEKLNIFSSAEEYAQCSRFFGEVENAASCTDHFMDSGKHASNADSLMGSGKHASTANYLMGSGEHAPNVDSLIDPDKHADPRIFRASASLPGALKHLTKCFTIKDQHFDTRVRNALSEVLIAFSTPYSGEKTSPALNIEQSLRYIHEHLEEPIHVSNLPALDHLSLSSYNKFFTQAMGLPPGEYILKQKIEKTKELLTGTDLSVTEIACRYGFSSGQYFATAFKRFCNMTPTQYRQAAKDSAGDTGGSTKGNARDHTGRDRRGGLSGNVCTE